MKLILLISLHNYKIITKAQKYKKLLYHHIITRNIQRYENTKNHSRFKTRLNLAPCDVIFIKMANLSFEVFKY